MHIKLILDKLIREKPLETVTLGGFNLLLYLFRT